MTDADLHGEDAAPIDGTASLPALAEFATLARWQHVTRAAEELGMAQSTLSRRVRRLESTVGVALLRRTGRRVELTAAGVRLAAVADVVLDEVGRAVQDIRRSVDPEEGTVSVAFLSSLGVSVLPRALREFRAEHPHLQFRLTQDGHDAVLERLREGSVDLCLTSPPPEDPWLRSLALHEQSLRLVVPAGHALASVDRVRLASAAPEIFVGFKPGFGLRQLTDAWCRRAGFAPRLGFEGEDVATVRGMVSAGLGVALLPATRTSTPGTVELATTDVEPTRTIGLVTSRRLGLSPPAAAFHAFLARRGTELVARAMAEPTTM